MNFSGKFGSDQTIWYPASGCLGLNVYSLYNFGNFGYYWSASPYNDDACYLYFYNNGDVSPTNVRSRANGLSVRCLQESK